MSKIYLYSNIVLIILAIVALVLSVLDIIVKDNSVNVEGCPKENCIINANSITAKTSSFDRITNIIENTNISVNDLSNLKLNNCRISNISCSTATINQIQNNINLSNNTLIIGEEKSLNFKSLCIFSSDIGSVNLSSTNINCRDGFFSNLSINSISSTNLSGNTYFTSNANIQNLSGNTITCPNVTFDEVNFNTYTITNNININNVSSSKLVCANCTVSNISMVSNGFININNIITDNINSSIVNTNGVIINLTNSTFTNLINTVAIFGNKFTTRNMNTVSFTDNWLYNFFDIKCTNIVATSYINMKNDVTSTSIKINNMLYKVGDYNALGDAYIKNLTCTNVISKDTLTIDNIPLNLTNTSVNTNNIKYSLNINSILKAPLKIVNNEQNISTISINYVNKNLQSIYNNITNSFCSCIYVYPSENVDSVVYKDSSPNNINFGLKTTDSNFDPIIFTGVSIRMICSTNRRKPLFPYTLNFFNYIPGYSIDLYSNKNIFDYDSYFFQNIVTNGPPATINIYKGENNLNFVISVSITCTNIDTVNKKLIFLIIPI